MGALFIVAGAACSAAPESVSNALLRFPRSRTAAWLLSAAAVAWTAWIVHGASLGRFAFLEPWVLPAAPVVWILVNRWMDELLAPRALGGLLLLAANPLLRSVRMHPSSWSRMPAVLAYLFVLAGITLVLSPHLFRRACAPAIHPIGRLRLAGAVLTVAGIAIVLVGGLALR